MPGQRTADGRFNSAHKKSRPVLPRDGRMPRRAVPANVSFCCEKKPQARISYTVSNASGNEREMQYKRVRTATIFHWADST